MDSFFSNPKAQPINIKQTLFQYLRYWYLFVLGVGVCLAIAFVHLRFTVPQYLVSSTLLIKDANANPIGGGAGGALGELNVLSTAKTIENEIILLRSASLMQRALTELDMQTSFYFQGRFNDQEVFRNNLPIKLIINKIDSTAYYRRVTVHFKNNTTFDLEEGESVSSHQFGKEIQKPYATFTVVASPNLVLNETTKPIIIEFQDLQQLAIRYSGKLSVSTINTQASALRLSITDPVREKGKDILNKLVEVYNQEAIEDKNKTAANTLEFLDERIRFLTTELTTVEKGVEQYKRENEVTDVSSQASLYVGEASGYNKQFADIGIQIEVLESIERYVAKPNNEGKLIPSTLSVQDPTLSGLITRFNELQLEQERMLRVVQQDNPLVKNLQEQLVNMRENIQENLRNVKSSLIITRRNLQAQSGQFSAKIKNAPTLERELLEISRQQDIKQALYLFLLQKREESALTLAATVSNSRVIDPATALNYPISPNKTNIYIMAILLGMTLPFGGLYLRNLLNDKVQKKEEVERATPTPIIGEVLHNTTGITLVVKEKSRTPIAEVFRLVRTNLHFATAGQENKVILITSSISGEGKTFFSINLAAALVQTGKKVVILDFDLRRPSLLNELEVISKKGITDYLISESITLDEIVKPVPETEGIFVIGSGTVPPNPAVMMSSPKIGQLLSLLKENFDYIILDTAPVGLVADAFSLASYIDSTIFLMRYNYTKMAHIDIVNDIFNGQKLSFPMIVLNDAKKQNSVYGYEYGYGKEKEKRFKFNESGT